MTDETPAPGAPLTWIFAYGSLVSPASLATTIGRVVTPGKGMHVAELRGYGRRWNYGSKVLRGSWTTDAGQSVEHGLVVSLGVAAAPDESINGVVFAVDAPELENLDWRERAYDRVDVSDRIRLLDADSTLDGPVAVYVPRPSSIARYETHRDAGTAAVRASYWKLVDDAFAELGDEHLAWYRRTGAPDVPVADITLDAPPSNPPNPLG